MHLDQLDNPEPGFYEIHSAAGASWRSTPPSRHFSEEILAPKVTHFTSARTSTNTTASSHSAPFRRTYQIGTSWLEIIQEPWETIPTLHILDQD